MYASTVVLSPEFKCLLKHNDYRLDFIIYISF